MLDKRKHRKQASTIMSHLQNNKITQEKKKYHIFGTLRKFVETAVKWYT